MVSDLDLSIYFIADPECCAERPVVDVVMEAAKFGVTMVQYRDKLNERPMIAANAAVMAEFLKPMNIPLIINDYVDIASSSSADGVHLGQSDVNVHYARQKLGFDAIIGQTAYTQEQIGMVDDTVVDYIGLGPFYPTKTDKGKPVLGAEQFSVLANLRDIPVVGIGGITPDNAAEVMAAGADGVAMMRSISEAEDIAAAVQAFKSALQVSA